ncbi:ATP-grasp domain-containing protein [Rhizobium sp. SEMIA 4085]|nr:ATP-grasp domain-containing protein [Rhizobium sp. SEMIA 4085]
MSRLMGDEKPAALLYGSGFERQPEVIDALGRVFPLAGNSADTVRAIKDPANLSQLCRSLDIPHPPIQFSLPEKPEGWLTKLGGGAGGSHVRPGATRPALPGYSFQKRMSGRSISALFLAQNGAARIIGVSRQWSSPSPTSPFRYGGAVRLMRFDRQKKMQMGCWLDKLTRHCGLVGLCSADFIDGSEGLHLIEINPRPGATLDIFDTDSAPLLIEHLRAVRGERIEVPVYRGAAAAAIAYTSRSISCFPDVKWPNLTADHQRPGSALGPGDPVCTVLAHARSASAAERAVKRRVNQVAQHWKEEFQ